MRFSCARCGQRYATVDDPKPGHDYRVPCVVCGGMVLLKGADFPALPTSPPDPRVAPGHGDAVDAAGEEPLAFTLAAVAPRDAPARPRPPGTPSRGRARSPQRWITVAATGTIALATLGAGYLLLAGGTARLPPAPAPLEPPAATPPGAPAPGARAAPASATRPGAPPAPAAPGAQGGGAAVPSATAATAAAKAPAAVVKVPAAAASVRQGSASPGRPSPPSPAKRAAPPVANRATSSDPGAPAAGAPEAPAAPARPAPDQLVAEAVAARRPAFDSCVREWAWQEPGLWVPGRRVDLLLTVQPSGTVVSPRVDDPALEGTSLASCLRGAAGKPFPPFEGDPVQVRIPFRLGE